VFIPGSSVYDNSAVDYAKSFDYGKRRYSGNIVQKKKKDRISFFHGAKEI
jgi:hypothetical protein